MALSNPSDVAECTAREAFEASQGLAVYASGTAFQPFKGSSGQQFRPSQVNNALIFPGERPAAAVHGSSVALGCRTGLHHSAGVQCLSSCSWAALEGSLHTEVMRAYIRPCQLHPCLPAAMCLSMCLQALGWAASPLAPPRSLQT